MSQPNTLPKPQPHHETLSDRLRQIAASGSAEDLRATLVSCWCSNSERNTIVPPEKIRDLRELIDGCAILRDCRKDPVVTFALRCLDAQLLEHQEGMRGAAEMQVPLATQAHGPHKPPDEEGPISQERKSAGNPGMSFPVY